MGAAPAVSPPLLPLPDEPDAPVLPLEPAEVLLELEEPLEPVEALAELLEDELALLLELVPLEPLVLLELVPLEPPVLPLLDPLSLELPLLEPLSLELGAKDWEARPMRGNPSGKPVRLGSGTRAEMGESVVASQTSGSPLKSPTAVRLPSAAGSPPAIAKGWSAIPRLEPLPRGTTPMLSETTSLPSSMCWPRKAQPPVFASSELSTVYLA